MSPRETIRSTLCCSAVLRTSVSASTLEWMSEMIASRIGLPGPVVGDPADHFKRDLVQVIEPKTHPVRPCPHHPRARRDVHAPPGAKPHPRLAADVQRRTRPHEHPTLPE